MKHLTDRTKGQLDFIARVLAEAERDDRTQTERASFLAITERSLEEFLTVRCPKPTAEVRERVEQLYAKLDHQVKALVPVQETDAGDEGKEPVFRVLVDQSLSCKESDGEVRQAVEACLQSRAAGRPVQLECEQDTPDETVEAYRETHAMKKVPLRRWPGRVCASELLKSLINEGREDKPDEESVPDDLFSWIGQADRVLIHPYDSMEPVIRLLETAAEDAHVCTIRITLYRTDDESRFVKALIAGAKRGAAVTAVLEIRARGNEQANMRLMDEMTAAGVQVICPMGPRVHGKLLLIEREEAGATCRYLHVGTGNYHSGNARHYTDVSLMTSDAALCDDAAAFFEAVGTAKEPALREMSMSPYCLRAELLRLIRREMSSAMAKRPCGITAKLNALTDERIIDALYDASRLGVTVNLIVRGECRLQTDAAHVSDQITVRSIVGRELEHARVIRFMNGGVPEVYISSADWMTRSFDRRHELLIPVRDAAVKSRLCDWLDLQLRDTANAWELHGDEYTARRCCGDGEKKDAQAEMRRTSS